MSEESTPSEFAAFAALRREIGPPPGGSGFDLAQRLADLADDAFRRLAAPLAGVAVFAVGGYGRRELCLQSDLDLLILHDGPPPTDAVRTILYPLWDAGIKVGHATRTVKATLAFAREDHHGLCSLLSLRQLSGPPGLAGELAAGLARLLAARGGSLAERLAAEEREVWTREPFPLQSLDVKGGRGGLRSLHRLEWDRKRSALLDEESILPEQAEEWHARRLLIDVRQALHALRGRAADTLPLELRPSVGAWLGREPAELATELYRAARTVDGLAAVRWGQVRPAGADPVAFAGLAISRLVRSRWGRRQPMATPLAFATAAANSISGGRLSSWERGFASRAGPPDWQAGDRAGLISLLASGLSGWEALCGLWESGWLPRALPEIAHLRGLAQEALFHRHPVDAHLGATVAAAVRLADTPGGWIAEAVERLGSLDELMLAAFLHDIGKGLAGDHSTTGSALASSLLRRLGFALGTVDLVAAAVRHHLLLPEVAARRDPDDPQVVVETARLVGSAHLLRLLAVLSVADAQATGPEIWSPWKESLLRGLVLRLEPMLENSPSDLESQHLAELERALPTVAPHAIHSFLAAMPSSYLASFGPELVARHYGLLHPPPAPASIRFEVISGAPVSTVVIASRDRPALLAAVAGVLSLRNLNVLEARAVTRSDGLVLDTFRVSDALGSGMVGPGRWPSVRELLAAAARGELELAALLAEKRRAYPPQRPVVAPEVRVSGRYIDVRASDRVGLLYDLATTLADMGVGIELAKIDTRVGEAIDVFQVTKPEELPDDMIKDRLLRILEMT